MRGRYRCSEAQTVERFAEPSHPRTDAMFSLNGDLNRTRLAAKRRSKPPRAPLEGVAFPVGTSLKGSHSRPFRVPPPGSSP
jgi:hypothetical protein